MEDRLGIIWSDQVVTTIVPTGDSDVLAASRDNGEESDFDIPDELAILPLRGVVLYPMAALPLTVGQPRSIQLVDEAVLQRQMIGLVATKSEEIEEPVPDDLYRMGTAVVVHRLRKAADGTLLLFVQGIERIRILEFTSTEPYLKARVEPAPDTVEDSVELEALSRNIIELFRRLVSLVPHIPDEMLMMVMNIEDPRQLAYLVATSLRMDTADAQEVLELDDVQDKLRKLTAILNRELEVLELGKKIQSEAQSEMEKVQREYYLREQLKAIKRELGEEDEQSLELEEYRRKIEEAGMPEEARKEALRELSRMEKMPTAAAEYSVIKTYLDWMTSLPWSKATEDNLDIARARLILDEDHYDLEEVKDRILEYLAVRKLRLERAEERAEQEQQISDYIRKEREGVILCFVGPPGTGKTSLGQSIARALGRKFMRMSLGGVRDEAEIRGFRRTYVGSMPGRIIQALRRVESRNPVFMLDEVDKIGADWRGDPSSALLEVLDPEQNRDFRDHYLDVPFDLSQVMFITTANLLEPIPAPLRDRMEILVLDGYTEQEKIKIAQQYLIPRQIRENGLRPDEVEITEEAIYKVVSDYTREAGVRNLERELGTICRKVATSIAEGAKGAEGAAVVTEEDITNYLGKPKYFSEVAERTEIPGVATGLVVTAVGGDITFIEATRMRGKQGLILTGQLGDVMRESAQAALSYVRSKTREMGIDEDLFLENDIHIHVPAGAVPKDGPSAGVTMATALASLLTGKPVDSQVAMTGEITLRGQVLPVGGIKQKVLAAARVGLNTVILPKRNEADLEDIPAEVREKMHFVLADRVEQVIQHALSDGKEGK
ncbi:MAG: endopeptidase La [Chloroflexota bacterium]|nr:endopeptidase La [Chloroflexota bacterium]